MKRIRIVLFLIGCFGLFQGLSAQCGTAYLTSDDTVVCVPKIVRFKVHKFPAGTTFEWDFGSGYVSSDSTYTKLYSAAGNYNVRIRLTYLDGSCQEGHYVYKVRALSIDGVTAFNLEGVLFLLR
jgi:hypothetical protein